MMEQRQKCLKIQLFCIFSVHTYIYKIYHHATYTQFFPPKSHAPGGLIDNVNVQIQKCTNYKNCSYVSSRQYWITQFDGVSLEFDEDCWLPWTHIANPISTLLYYKSASKQKKSKQFFTKLNEPYIYYWWVSFCWTTFAVSSFSAK